MTIHYFDDMSIYFHMRNHFKKLKHVKSTIIFSSKGFTKQCSNIPHSEKSIKQSYCNEKQIKNVSSFVHHNSIKRYNNTSSETKSETSVRPSSLPPRPITRRHPYETPHQLQKSRSASETPVIKTDIAPLRSGVRHVKRKIRHSGHKMIESKGNINSITDDTNKSSSKSSQTNKSPKKEIFSSDTEHSGRSKTDEQEYLQFLLRITEDIILNNYFKNEDIAKVFQNHIEINRHRLALEKMEMQIMRLASELNIPYQSSVEQFVEQTIVNTPQCIYEAEYNDNCECSTQRTLNFSGCVSTYNSYFNTKDSQGNMEDVLNNRHSLGRVTECTEPTNSFDTIFNASTKFPSVTTVSSFGNIDVLPCFENTDVDLSKRNDNFYQTIVQDSNSANLTKFIDVPLTEKERIGCLEEDIIFEKLNKAPQFLVPSNGKDIVLENSLNLLKERDSQENVESKKAVLECIDTCSEKSSQKTVCLNEVPSISTIDEKLELNEHIVVKVPSEIREIKPDLSVIPMEDKCTQVEIIYCDKECTAAENVVDEVVEENSYIRMDGPVYVKKIVLQSDGKLVLSEEDAKKINIEGLKNTDQFTVDDNLHNQHGNTEFMVPTILQQNEKCLNIIEKNDTCKNNEESSELQSERRDVEKLKKDNKHEEKSIFNRPLNISDYSLDTYSELDKSYMRKITYSKLLNSDYDLTPQRDSTNSADKYHHLLVDASTSISNMYLPESNLLITEDYYLIKPHIERENHDFHGCNKVKNNNYCLSCNNLLRDDKYEIENCRLPEELNESMRHFESRNNMRKKSDVTLAIDVPSTDYEISSDISISIEGGEITGNNYVKNQTTSTSSLLGFQEENSITLHSSCPNRQAI